MRGDNYLIRDIDEMIAQIKTKKSTRGSGFKSSLFDLDWSISIKTINSWNMQKLLDLL